MFATSSNSEIQTYGIEFILLNHAVYTYICIYIVCVCVCVKRTVHIGQIKICLQNFDRHA